ncbi:transcriptional regulator [Limnohabitans sp. T6-5]|uniref:RNA-binding domain-containing protein n=1 Tax=Limnohabitans sp. T6-5 TaxID=1100724 RepID=UPI000D3C8CC9|nr:RNA-binding domain-containing protein [Limnohabitans sp. T6-5]PUE09321.1 transcriptional regulator [Limnohabitans sp. T6-5]
MDQAALSALLDELMATWENEVVEFKQAGNDYDTDKIGEYFSALANEANLRGVDRAWLVFGVSNKTRSVVGSDYRPQPERLQSLKSQIADSTEPSVTLRNIHVLQHAAGRVVLMEVPPAPRGMPIAWKGHYYARAGESRTSLGLDKLDEIRQQTLLTDWTAQLVPGATLAHLDELALQLARSAFAQKYANRFSAEEVMAWPVAAFLERAHLLRDGQITRGTLLLLGKSTSAHLLSPHPAQLTWKLEGPERAYEHFGLPFLVATSELYQRIRNVQIRILPDNVLIPVEVSKYDRRVVLEALHNCIAHQDYSRSGRIVVTETPATLVFENEGQFFDGQPDDYIAGNKTPRRYRNPFLAQAMAELNMIDTMGYGIHWMHREQARRYFPMPDYDLSEAGAVRMTVYGSVVDLAYSRLLIQKTDLPLADVLALDRVQKKLPIPTEAADRLRKFGLIEGRKPNLHVAAHIAKATGSVAAYLRTRGQDDAFYIKQITDYLAVNGEANRADINQLLLGKLSDALTDGQKYTKVSNLLGKLRRRGAIVNVGSDAAPRWQLTQMN